MRVSQAFPSNYLRASDLQGKEPTVTIARVEMEDIGDDRKPVVYFAGKEKGVVLNKTNANNISMLYGDDTDNWIGKPIGLYATYVDFQGRSVEAIRVKPARANGNGHHVAPPPPPPRQPEPPLQDLDDEIPF